MYLIETEQLAQKLEAGEQVKLVDATLFMPASGKNAADEFVARRITDDTVLFDVCKVVDPDSSLPVTMPNVLQFIDHMKKLDI